MEQAPKLLPRDEERFSRLSPEPKAVLPPGTTFPTGEELAKESLERMALVRNRYDGN